ncbi:triacylglycerol lipase [Oceanobacillus sp. AG]|uniref:esterase/lipase family protein n=1 Tax=Oceanobacillus sp. AG TaxID=2681969 RepID=UPI0012EC376E|nr:hypothetical protein [Oceanobacillus sp. AG]
MKRFKHVLSVCVLTLSAIGMYVEGSVSITAQAQMKVPPPVLIEGSVSNSIAGSGGNGNEETPGEWYRGETPDNLMENAPVLLFVPGLNNVAQIFWEDNNMYDTAYQAGYQTAFVQLHDAGGESADMWNNGELLASKIREISLHFNRKPITVVAYSKGGVDTHAAITYYGAGPYMENVITLSSPHHGSELADLAYSSGAGWLAALIGLQGEGTASMQTAYMADFRMQTDANAKAYQHNYFTLGGTGWGPAFSANWFGGVYLSSYGPNDGVVTAASSNLPGGQELLVGDWNHTSIRTGATFPVFQNYLSGEHLTAAQSKSPISDQKNMPAPITNRWVDGGPIVDKAEIELNVEKNVKSLTLQFLTAEPLTDVELVSPYGKVVNTKVKEVPMTEGIFKDAIGYILEIPAPEAGAWTIAVQSNAEENAYLFVADFESTPLIKANKGYGVMQQVELQADAKQINLDSLVVDYHMVETQNPDNQKKWKATGRNALSHNLNLDKHKKGSIYTVTIIIEGKTKEGHAFNRSVIYSY